ncbi:MAG: bifunctional 3-(3-hydroxy-phenyl)propionate/3-hydroxycinnamic acid hydroxylase [Pseudomonadota bacterium]
MEHFDVAIIGYGPTGAALANLLGQCGVNVVVLEREAAAYHLPRAVHFDGEIMRILQWIGIAEEMEPLTALHPGMKFVDGNGETMLDWPRPKGVGAQRWRSAYRFHQPDLERLLREKAATFPNISVRNRCDLFYVEDEGEHVALRYENMSCGRIERISASYVVGCDGARSTIKRYIETDMEDFGFHERWLVIDAILNDEKPELGEYSVQFCIPQRPATYVRGPGMRRRWEITINQQEDPQKVTKPDYVWDLLSDWLKPDEAELERIALYVFHSLLAKTWRKGRLLLAGDACHQTPPFMGQGMCTGIRDAANLYWKLALLCKGAVPAARAEDLLASYEKERKPNARTYIETAIRLGGLINTSKTKEDLQAALPVCKGGVQMQSISPPLGKAMGYGDLAGHLFGQPQLDDGSWIDDDFLHEFLVVADTKLAKELALPDDVGLITTDMSSDAASHLSRLDVGAVILRPDRYIFAGANSTDELNAQLKKILPSPTGVASVTNAQ